MSLIKEFSYLDFEIDSNALITFLTIYGYFDKITIKNITYKSSKDENYIIIERELLNTSKIKTNFPNIEIIDDDSIVMGRLKLIIS